MSNATEQHHLLEYIINIVIVSVAIAQEFRIPAGAGMMFPEGDLSDGFLERE